MDIDTGHWGPSVQLRLQDGSKTASGPFIQDRAITLLGLWPERCLEFSLLQTAQQLNEAEGVQMLNKAYKKYI